MQLLILMLKTGQTIISQFELLEMEPRVHLSEPYEITGKTKVTLTPWPPYTKETDILLTSDSILTDVEPLESIRDSYLKKIGKTMEDLQTKDNRVLLTEDENVPDLPPPPEEDYEPMYIEEDL